MRLSLVWVIPIVAAVAGVWIAVTKILGKGPEITIVFSSADGLEANKTKIIYNGLDIGTLTCIRLMDDHKHVIATAEMNPKAKDFLVKDMKFWVVKPRMSGLSVSGLGTLISGYYIGVQLGQSKESERDFTALESPPVTGMFPGGFSMLRPGSWVRSAKARRFISGSSRPARWCPTNWTRRQHFERENFCAVALRPIRHTGHAFLERERS